VATPTTTTPQADAEAQPQRAANVVGQDRRREVRQVSPVPPRKILAITLTTGKPMSSCDKSRNKSKGAEWRVFHGRPEVECEL
jgi:hypothetical protein